MYWVYVLKSRVVQKSYVGSTNNLERRFQEHNEGKSRFTKQYIPWDMIYTEQYQTEKEARDREKFLKSRSGRRFMKNMIFK